MEKELDVVELENGKKLPVIDAINYQGRIFLLVGVLDKSQTNISDNLYVYEKINNELAIIEDNDLLEKLIQTFESRVYNMQ